MKEYTREELKEIYRSRRNVLAAKLRETSTGACIFIDCEELKEITIPSSVKIIGSYAFKGCDALESVDDFLQNYGAQSYTTHHFSLHNALPKNVHS